MVSDLSSAVARIVLEGDPASAREFVEALDRGALEAMRLIVEERPRSADVHTISLLQELAACAQRASASPQQITSMIEVAFLVRDRLAEEGERSALVWTGPRVHESAFRSTPQAVSDLIADAQSQILVASYSLRPETREPTQAFLTKLASARARGVGVTLILHQDEGNRRALIGGWPREKPLPRLLTWPIPESDEMVKLHAKIVEVDDQGLLITSANLTYHGMFANLEMGVMLRGGVAGDVRRHFDRLERDGHLVEWLLPDWRW